MHYPRRKKFYYLVQQQQPNSGKMRAADGSAAAADTQLVRQRMGPTIPGGLPPGLGGATHAEAITGKRDEYRYEAEYITDVAIDCILNR
jgi:hypothetical protein